MKEITKVSLQNLWDFCQEATDDEIGAADKFYTYADALLGRGSIDFDMVMDFIRENGIKRIKGGSRAKLVSEPVVKKPKVTRTMDKKPSQRKVPRWSGDSCGASPSSSCDMPRSMPNVRYRSASGCGASNPSC
jgi:hypothetical protein